MQTCQNQSSAGSLTGGRRIAAAQRAPLCATPAKLPGRKRREDNKLSSPARRDAASATNELRLHEADDNLAAKSGRLIEFRGFGSATSLIEHNLWLRSYAHSLIGPAAIEFPATCATCCPAPTTDCSAPAIPERPKGEHETPIWIVRAYDAIRASLLVFRIAPANSQ